MRDWGLTGEQIQDGEKVTRRDGKLYVAKDGDVVCGTACMGSIAGQMLQYEKANVVRDQD